MLVVVIEWSFAHHGLLLVTTTISVLTAISPGEPELAGFTGAKDNGSSGDNWSYKTCKAPVKSSPSAD